MQVKYLIKSGQHIWSE